MAINFLVGSGISLESGMKNVSEITDSVCHDVYFEHTDGSVIQGQHPSEYLRDHYDLEALQEFVIFIREQHDEYLKSRHFFGQQANYEDIFYILDQIEGEVLGRTDNLLLKQVVEHYSEISFPMRKKYRSYPLVPDLKNFVGKCKRFIEYAVRYGLNYDEIRGIDIFSDLIQSGNELNIFSLNHDTLVEDYCEQNGYSIIDGFGELDGNVRWYSPNEYDDNAQVRLFKLHGSRNWYWVRSENRDDTWAIMMGREKWYGETEAGAEVQMLLEDGNFLTGINKALQYYDGIFGELHFRFSSILRETRKLIVSGYGWGDKGINRKLLDWLRTYDEAQMLVIHRYPEDLLKNSRYVNKSLFQSYQKQGKIKFVEKWFQDVEENDITQFIAG